MTFGTSGPPTSGIGGSGGAFRGVMPRSNVAIVGGETGAFDRGLVEPAGVGPGAE
jgi:hypothetical protein